MEFNPEYVELRPYCLNGRKVPYGTLPQYSSDESFQVVPPAAVSRFNKKLPSEDQASPAVVAKSRLLLEGDSVWYGTIRDGYNRDNYTQWDRMMRAGYMNTVESARFDATTGEIRFDVATRLRAERMSGVLTAISYGLMSPAEQQQSGVRWSDTVIHPYNLGKTTLDYLQMFYDRGVTA